MCYLALIFGIGLCIYDAKADNAGNVVLYSEKNFQGITKAYSFVAMKCVGNFPAVLNESVRSLKTDHPIALHQFQDCKGNLKVNLRSGSYPDLPSIIRDQQPEFKTVIKSFFMYNFKQDNIQLFSRPGPKGQNPKLLLTVLVADINLAFPCLTFNDSLSTNINGVDNHLNCLVFYTGKDCGGKSFTVDPEENKVNLQDYEESQTYYGMKLCDKDNGPKKDVTTLEAALLTLEITKNDPYDKPTPHQDLIEE